MTPIHHRLGRVAMATLGTAAVLSVAACGPTTTKQTTIDAAAAAATAPPTKQPATDLVPVDGTKHAVPVPPRAIGSERRPLTIGLADGKTVVHGIGFERPGPIAGSHVGGVTIVFRDAMVDGSTQNDLAALAADADPGARYEVHDVAGKHVISWPDDHEVVPADGLSGVKDRTGSRFVIALEEGGSAMVTFDGVDATSAAAYLATLAGAL